MMHDDKYYALFWQDGSLRTAEHDSFQPAWDLLEAGAREGAMAPVCVYLPGESRMWIHKKAIPGLIEATMIALDIHSLNQASFVGIYEKD